MAAAPSSLRPPFSAAKAMALDHPENEWSAEEWSEILQLGQDWARSTNGRDSERRVTYERRALPTLLKFLASYLGATTPWHLDVEIDRRFDLLRSGQIPQPDETWWEPSKATGGFDLESTWRYTQAIRRLLDAFRPPGLLQ